MSDNVKILLVGCGNMGKEYCKVLKNMGMELVVIGRSEAGAKAFEKEMSIEVISGGIAKAFEKIADVPGQAIVAVGAMETKSVVEFLIQHGVKRILVEKPAGMNCDEISEIHKCAKENQTKVYVGYNRRYYESVRKAIELITEDGGVDSFHFEFTEWGHVIEKLDKPEEELEQWFLMNSSHVLDLAFFLGGKPKEMATFTGGKDCLEWHKKCSKYAGAGVTEKGALFSYHANYGAPGRWAVEILTRSHRFYLKPLEQLFVQEIGSVKVEPVELEDQIDKDYKPGLYREVESFVYDKNILLPTIEEQLENVRLYQEIECES